MNIEIRISDWINVCVPGALTHRQCPKFLPSDSQSVQAQPWMQIANHCHTGRQHQWIVIMSDLAEDLGIWTAEPDLPVSCRKLHPCNEVNSYPYFAQVFESLMGWVISCLFIVRTSLFPILVDCGYLGGISKWRRFILFSQELMLSAENWLHFQCPKHISD